jgi:hypothetical protein
MGRRSFGVASMMVRFLCAAFEVVSLLVSVRAGAVQDERGRVSHALARLPKRGVEVAAFVPQGWSTESSLEQDLNADQQPDTVLVVLEDGEDDGGAFERQRALVILLRQSTGFVLGGANAGLLQCLDCAGAKGGDGRPELKVERGVLIVEQLMGSRWFNYVVSRFRWNRARRAFELIGEDVTSSDALEGSGTDTSCNFLTRRCIATTRFAIPEDGVEPAPAVRRWRTPKAALVLLEQASLEDTLQGAN